MRRIVFYTKPGCHLCEDAFDLLLTIGDELGAEFSIKEVNILDDPTLYARYRDAIPVITIDPEGSGPTLRAPITAPDLRQALS